MGCLGQIFSLEGQVLAQSLDAFLTPSQAPQRCLLASGIATTSLSKAPLTCSPLGKHCAKGLKSTGGEQEVKTVVSSPR